MTALSLSAPTLSPVRDPRGRGRKQWAPEVDQTPGARTINPFCKAEVDDVARR